MRTRIENGYERVELKNAYLSHHAVQRLQDRSGLGIGDFLREATKENYIIDRHRDKDLWARALNGRCRKGEVMYVPALELLCPVQSGTQHDVVIATIIPLVERVKKSALVHLSYNAKQYVKNKVNMGYGHFLERAALEGIPINETNRHEYEFGHLVRDGGEMLYIPSLEVVYPLLPGKENPNDKIIPCIFDTTRIHTLKKQH